MSILKSDMKKKIVLGTICLLVALGIVSAFRFGHLNAATDTCMGVSTEFNASFPSSVTAGQAFNLTNITSKPSNSYGVTVTSSTLELSATNASETTYSRANTHTDPPSTAGASTYTAYYPDWALSATGTGGSQIVVKLVKATAQVSGIGAITCPLSATLATINITAPASSGGSSGGTTKPSSSNNTSSTTPSTDPVKQVTSQTSTEQTKKVSVTVTVRDKNNKAVKGAKVTLDDQQIVETDTDGAAYFKEVTPGEHTLSALYKGEIIEQAFSVSPDKQINEVSVVVPVKSELLSKIKIGAIGVLAVLIVGIVLVLLRRRSNHSGFKPAFTSPGIVDQAQVFTGDMSVAPPADPTPPPPFIPNQPLPTTPTAVANEPMAPAPVDPHTVSSPAFTAPPKPVVTSHATPITNSQETVTPTITKFHA